MTCVFVTKFFTNPHPTPTTLGVVLHLSLYSTGSNLALKKPSYQSATQSNSLPENANDGDKNTMSGTQLAPNNYWYVDLQNNVPVEAVVIQPSRNIKYTTNRTDGVNEADATNKPKHEMNRYF